MKRRSSGHILYGIYFFQTRVLEQTEAGNAKDGVEDVDHITRSVCQATQFRILLWLDSDGMEEKIVPTWHCRMKLVNLWPSIQCSLSSMAMLLMTHQL
jgi:hypothetical protein